MKTKNKKETYIKRHHQGFMALFIGLLLFCLVRYEKNVAHVAQQAYYEGFTIIGTYMREGETTRYPVNLGISTRIQTISGR